MKRRALALLICLAILLVGVSAAGARRAGGSKTATITTQSWRQGEYSCVRLVSLDDRRLPDRPDTRAEPGEGDAEEVSSGVTSARIAPGRHALGIRFAPTTLRRLDDPGQELPAKLVKPAAFRTITFESQAGRTYVVRARSWIRPDPDIPYGKVRPETLQVKFALVDVAARCDVVWIVDRKTEDRVACATYPEGCLVCDDVVPPP